MCGVEWDWGCQGQYPVIPLDRAPRDGVFLSYSIFAIRSSVWSSEVAFCLLGSSHPSLVAGRRLQLGQSMMRRPLPHRRSSSCCSCSPPTRRPSRRHAASVSTQLNRNCSRPQDLVQLRRRPRHADGLMQQQGVRSVRIAARSAVPSEAHGITRNCRCNSTAPLSRCFTSVVSGGCVEHGGYRHVWLISSLSMVSQ